MSLFLAPLINAEEASSLCGRVFRGAYWMAGPTAQEAAVTKRARSLQLFSSARPPPLPALRWRLSRYHASNIVEFTTSDYQKSYKRDVTKITAKA
jgi:hypothetical protein